MSKLKPPEIKTRRIELDGEFEGYWFVSQINPPMYVLADMMSGNPDRMIASLNGIVKEWNFVGFDGEPLDLTNGGVRLLPTDLFQAMAAAAQNAPFDIPKN